MAELDPTAGLRVGMRASNPCLHIGRVRMARKALPDLGEALCGAPVVLVMDLTGPKGNRLGDEEYCEGCSEAFRTLEGTAPKKIVKRGKKAVQFVMEL